MSPVKIMCMRLVIVLLLNGSIFGRHLQRPSVRLQQGQLVGVKTITESGHIVDVYLGVPYAAIPIGNLRFAPPQRHVGWNGTYESLDYGPSCPQLPIKPNNNQSEDCLYLNIWAPQDAYKYGPLPVVLFYEGTEFAESSNVLISGQDLAMEGLVVVTVNYRLNVFGFLCFENRDVRGNMGLLDQYYSLLWVRENIRAFGGDAGKITLYGHSAGAASVLLHMISPRTAGYFQRIILSSGSAVSPWHMNTGVKSASLEIARILGCLNSYISSMIKCMRSKTTQDILKAYEDYIDSGNYTNRLLPVIDSFLPENDQYLPLNVESALRGGTYLQVPILTGITKTFYEPQFDQWADLASKSYSQLQQFIEIIKIPEIVRRYNFQNRDQVQELIKWRYVTPTNGNVRLLLEQLKKLHFEAKIEAPHYLQLQYFTYSYVQPIYVYYLNALEFVPNVTDSLATTNLLLLFGPLFTQTGTRRTYNSKELRISRYLKQLWANFIIFGNPTPTNLSKKWRRYSSIDNYIEYIQTDVEVTKDETVEISRRVNFWNQLLPMLGNQNLTKSNIILRDFQYHLGSSSGYKHAVYTLSALVIALLVLLLICIIIIKQKARERERLFQTVY